MQLTNIQLLTGKIKLVTGMHIGAGNDEIHIGGIDTPVIKNALNQEPYIPGSSIKGKMRSLLEWSLGLVACSQGAPFSFQHLDGVKNGDQAKILLKLMGGAPNSANDEQHMQEIGPTRLAFWDCSLNADWRKQYQEMLISEEKAENSIDRIKGTAASPRFIERVPAGAEFDFKLSIRVHDDEDLTELVYLGLKLIEQIGLGGSVSRGYGKIEFQDLKLDGKSADEKLKQVDIKRSVQ